MMTAGARQEPDRVFDEHSDERLTASRSAGATCADRAPEDAAEPRWEAELAQRRAPDRRGDRRRASPLIDYHNCRVSVIEGDEVVPIAFRGELLAQRRARRLSAHAHRRGHHRPRRSAEPLFVPNTLGEYAVMIP
jgi:hypothetical protein